MQNRGIKLDFGPKLPSQLINLPFEMIMIIVSYSAAEESFAMIRLNKELRS